MGKGPSGGRGVCRTDRNRPHKNKRSGWAYSSDAPLLPASSCPFHRYLLVLASVAGREVQGTWPCPFWSEKPQRPFPTLP